MTPKKIRKAPLNLKTVSAFKEVLFRNSLVRSKRYTSLVH